MALSPQQQKVSVLLILSVLIAATLYFIEWETREYNAGYSSEAVKNPFLAAELFLEKYDIKSERSIRFTLLDSLLEHNKKYESEPGEYIAADDTLVLVNARGVIRGKRFEHLWQWLEGGGNLLISTENPFIGKLEKEDELFQALDVVVNNITSRQQEGEDKDDDNVDEDKSIEEALEDTPLGLDEEKIEDFIFSDVDVCGYVQPKLVHLPSETESIELAYTARKSIALGELRPEWILANEYGDEIIAANFLVGDGSVTVVPDVDIWRNRFIQCLDHAYLLLRVSEGSAKVWFLENHDAPSLFSYLFRYIPFAALAFLFFVVLALWAYYTRFGPVFTAKILARRSFAEHIHASANFMWKHSEYEKLIKELRVNVHHIMQRKVLSFERKSQDEQLEILAKYSRIDAQELRDPLFKDRVESLNEFVEFVRILKSVRDNV